MLPTYLNRSLSVLKRGGVVAAGTETFFALLADARSEDAVSRVFALKGRDATRGIALLIRSRDMWTSLVREIPPLAAKLADAFWPGPLTIALPAADDVDPRLQVDGTVGVRLPSLCDATRIMRLFISPLTATSANSTGEPPAVTDEHVIRAFPGEHVIHAFPGDLGGEKFYVVPGRTPGGSPSTVVRVDGDRVDVIRWGRIDESALATVVPRTAFG